MDVNNKHIVDNVIESGVLRKGYETMFIDVITRWEFANSDLEVKEMLDTLKVYSDRRKNGAGTNELATFLVATAKRSNNSLSIKNMAQLLEVIGTMFKGGGLVCKNIQSRFNDTALIRITRQVLAFENEMYRLRDKKGISSAEELNAVANAFGISYRFEHG